MMRETILKIKSYTSDIKLLYIEDSTSCRESTLQILNEMFSSVRVAEDGQEAWKYYQEDTFDLIITDIEMPKLDGLSFIKRIRTKGDETPVLITSAYDDHTYLTEAITLHIDGYILKPFILEQLLALILKTTSIIHMRQQHIHHEASLEKQVVLEIAKREERERLLMQQTKMAAMGEMVDAIAHQWRQPLSSISMYMSALHDEALERGSVDAPSIKVYEDDMDIQVNHLLNTLHEFRDFFKTDKETKSFSIRSLINSVLLLMKDELLANQIETELIVAEDIMISGHENELKHLLINLVNNAKDAFNDKDIKKRKLIFRVIVGENLCLEVEDNAGGIAVEIIDTIFNPRTTTKEEGKGSGIGLYMSKQIVQKNHGNLWVENTEQGAKFLASFPLDV